MAMDNEGGTRRQSIGTAIAAELAQQGVSAGVDVEALADAVERALESVPPASEGKRPNELNATNDD